MKNQAGSAGPTLALEWGIKQSLVRYIAGMADGSIVASKPATAVEGGFRFPSAASPGVTEPSRNDGALCFAGSVTLTGHGGMLKLVFTDPWLVPGSEPNAQWLLTIADPYEPGARIAFATIDRIDRIDPWPGGADGGDDTDEASHDVTGAPHSTAHGTRLTADGTDLFFSGPYTEGTELDDPRILGHA